MTNFGDKLKEITENHPERDRDRQAKIEHQEYIDREVKRIKDIILSEAKNGKRQYVSEEFLDDDVVKILEKEKSFKMYFEEDDGGLTGWVEFKW